MAKSVYIFSMIYILRLVKWTQTSRNRRKRSEEIYLYYKI
ncbi:2918_t:CDS:2 [Funneliformis mosseae]|uniref:2918_t:CDS:1 n=1 Tax=Funneliformis mosseae TaxID=27381 RepID=A0A9N8VDA0_FUNMO|nr:2918_t:CDS:2 [Funneliformis mosseae]